MVVAIIASIRLRVRRGAVDQIHGGCVSVRHASCPCTSFLARFRGIYPYDFMILFLCILCGIYQAVYRRMDRVLDLSYWTFEAIYCDGQGWTSVALEVQLDTLHSLNVMFMI